MSPLIFDYLVVTAVSSLTMTAGFLWQKKNQNAGIVDILWAGCLAFAAMYFGAVGSGAILPKILVALLGAAWGFRLAGHLISRVFDEPEEGRYAYLRAYWNNDQGKFFLFFQAQVLLILFFATPFYLAAQNPVSHWTVWLVLGVVIWIGALAGESIADYQLSQFRNNPNNKGKTCRTGLWRYSRHPNYFFEFLHWFSYCCFAVGAAHAWWALLAPLAMFCTLNWATGIPFVEAQSLRSRGDDYRDYQRTTSRLFPWFVRK